MSTSCDTAVTTVVLKPEALDGIRGVGHRFGEWLRACATDERGSVTQPVTMDVAFAGEPEVVATTRRLALTTTPAPNSLDQAEHEPIVTFHAVPVPACDDAAPWPLCPPPGDTGRLPTWKDEGGPRHESNIHFRGHEPADTVTLGGYDSSAISIAAIRTWLMGPSSPSARRSRLFVGNDPVVSMIAGQLAGPIALAHGELACLRRKKRRLPGRPRYRLLWTAAAHDEEDLEAIQGKVKSKISTAGALGTVLTGLLVFLLKDGVEEMTRWSWPALLAFLGAALLYFVALFYYDSLSMPSRFWAPSPRLITGRSASLVERLGGRMALALATTSTGLLTVAMLGSDGRWSPAWSSVPGWAYAVAAPAFACLVAWMSSARRPLLLRPPSSNTRMLHATMVHVWKWVFLPATVLAGLGVALLMGHLAWGAQELEVAPSHVAGAVTYGLLLVTYCHARAPKHGATD